MYSLASVDPSLVHPHRTGLRRGLASDTCAVDWLARRMFFLRRGLDWDSCAVDLPLPGRSPGWQPDSSAGGGLCLEKSHGRRTRRCLKTGPCPLACGGVWRRVEKSASHDLCWRVEKSASHDLCLRVDGAMERSQTTKERPTTKERCFWSSIPVQVNVHPHINWPRVLPLQALGAPLSSPPRLTQGGWALRVDFASPSEIHGLIVPYSESNR